MPPNFYLSEDGEAFVENGDKYLIPVSKRETSLYTDHPEVFTKDFLKNVRLYIRFMNWIHGLQSRAVLLEMKEKFIGHSKLSVDPDNLFSEPILTLYAPVESVI